MKPKIDNGNLRSLLVRHAAFWQMAEAEKPLMRIREYQPLSRGGGYPDAVRNFEDGQRISPETITSQNLLCEEPNVFIDDDLIIGVQLPGLCWTEAVLGCPIKMGSGGLWADAFISNKRDIRDRLKEKELGYENPWLAKFRVGTRLLCERAKDRYPVLQPLMRGPVDMMASAFGHQQMATSFLDFPREAAGLLDLCTDLFIKMAEEHVSHIPPFHGGYVTYGIWTPGPVIRTQLDNAVLLSPRMYRYHYLPRDMRVFHSFDYVVIHVHSSSLHIVDDLMTQSGLNAIQVTLDVSAGPSVEKMLAILKMIQEYKPLIITGPLTERELDLLLDCLKPSGLCLDLQKKNE